MLPRCLCRTGGGARRRGTNPVWKLLEAEARGRAAAPANPLRDRGLLLGVGGRDRAVREDVGGHGRVDRGGDVRVDEAHRLAVRQLGTVLLGHLGLAEALLGRPGGLVRLLHLLRHVDPPSFALRWGRRPTTALTLLA